MERALLSLVHLLRESTYVIVCVPLKGNNNKFRLQLNHKLMNPSLTRLWFLFLRSRFKIFLSGFFFLGFLGSFIQGFDFVLIDYFRCLIHHLLSHHQFHQVQKVILLILIKFVYIHELLL